ncbi:Imm32 family immunity protein [Massilia varians]|uniref:Imm32 family immunity protein n=1 Tax=Massilia varians TaxID=457921 RepID=UPI00255679C1|nr:Imm32 family immunity protein [Massilia varians]MDK6078809.1 Imm32 family immunity protein [Massilia varians]
MKEIEPPNYLLSVTSTRSGDAVTVHVDKEGLLALRARLDVLLAKLDGDASDHEHLRSAEWAGFELTTSMLASERTHGHQTVHHVEIYAWSPEWKEHYGL